MAAHRIFNYFGRIFIAWLAVMALAASEQHGVVKSNGVPVPGATVTATQGDKKLATTTDDNGAYSFADLPDGIWTIGVEMFGFAKLSREVGVNADAPSPTWDLKVQSLSALNTDIAEAKKPPTPSTTAAAPATAAATTPDKPVAAATTPPAATAATPAAATTAKAAAKPPTPSLRAAQQNLQNGGRGGFRQLGVNASGDQSDAGAVDLGGGDVNQSSSDALVVGGSVSDALGMPQQNDWGFGGGRGGDFGGPGGINGDGTGGPGGPGGFGGRGQGGPGGGGPGGGGPGGGGMMAGGGGPGGFGGGGGGGRGGGGAPGGRGGRGGPGRGGRGNTNSFGNGRRNPRSQYTGNVVFSLDNSIWDAEAYSLTGAQTAKPAYAKFKAGFTFGGPLKIPHLFDDSTHGGTFTVTYNLNRARSASTLFGEVPTAAERAGDFAGALNSTTGTPVTIYDPTTGQPFAADTIPTNRINSAAVGLLSYYPLPNLAGNAKYNYQLSNTSISNLNNINVRGNHSFSQRDQISFSEGYQDSNGDSPNFFNFLDSTKSSGYNFNPAWTHRFTPISSPG